MPRTSNDETSVSELAPSQASSTSSTQDSPTAGHASSSPPHKKSRKSHKSHRGRPKMERNSSESELDDEKENLRTKRKKPSKKGSHERRQMKRERLSRPESGTSSEDDAEGRDGEARARRQARQETGDPQHSEEDPERRRHKARDSSGAEWPCREHDPPPEQLPGDSEPRHRDRQRARHGHTSRDRANQHQLTRRGSASPERAVRVKEEPLSGSDQEHRHRRRRRRDDDEPRRRRDDHPPPDNIDLPARQQKREYERSRKRCEDDRRRRETSDRRHGSVRGGRRTDVGAGERADGDRWGLHESASAPAADAPPASKEAPNFELSGKLVEDTNTVNGVVVKYSEPPEARKPKRRWRLYVFKGDDSMPTLHIHRQSAFLMGRDRKVADIPIDHPSCSKQHAALQYRLAVTKRADGTTARLVKPYIIDLDSANGTFVNNQRIESRRYVELLERDVIKFGFSSREYVLLHDSSQPDAPSSED